MPSKRINEFETEKEALETADYYAERVLLDSNEENYEGLIMGKYMYLYPVIVEKDSSFMPSKGWMCLNIINNTYRIINKLNARRMFLEFHSNEIFFGMKYIKGDFSSLNINEEQFEQEFISQIDALFSSISFEPAKEKIKEYSNSVNKYVENLRANLDYFSKLDSKEYNNEIDRITKRFHFEEVDDMSKCTNCLYLIALDSYKQFYVGKTVSSLTSRMRKHWTAKIIPSRQIWKGGFDYSRIKFDNFKIFDCSRVFVCKNISSIIEENNEMANDFRIECNNTFGLDFYENMTILDKAERIVINNCLCKFCLSDRVPLLTAPVYDDLQKKYGVSKNQLLIMQYNNYFDYKPLERTKERMDLINSLKK